MAGKTRERRNWQNAQKAQYEGVGIFDIPQIHGVDWVTNVKWVRFNDLASRKPKQPFGVHFFIDDYKFERIWTNIDRYLPLLQKAEYVMSPDFSLYLDFPRAQSIWNHYRKHWIGAYLEEHGVKVIPTVNWMYEDDYSWVFDGEPTNKVVAVSALGCTRNKDELKMFLDGYEEMIKRLNPSQVLFYGKIPDGVTQDQNLIRIESFSEEMRRLTRGQ